MSTKFLLSFLTLFLFASCAVFATLPNSEIIFYKQKTCRACSAGKNITGYPTSNLSETKRFSEQLNDREKQFYCDATKMVINNLSQALSSDIESSENIIFSTSSYDIAKYFSLTLPAVNSYDKRTVITSDFSYDFFSNGECNLPGYCYVKIDLNKNNQPNANYKDIIYVNLLFNGRKIELEYDPAGIYRRIMCGE